MKIGIKIFWTMVISLILIMGGVTLKLAQYSTNQEYSQIAADQFDKHTDAYKILHSQEGVNDIFYWLYAAGILISIFLLYRIWFKDGKIIQFIKDKTT